MKKKECGVERLKLKRRKQKESDKARVFSRVSKNQIDTHGHGSIEGKRDGFSTTLLCRVTTGTTVAAQKLFGQLWPNRSPCRWGLRRPTD